MSFRPIHCHVVSLEGKETSLASSKLSARCIIVLFAVLSLIVFNRRVSADTLLSVQLYGGSGTSNHRWMGVAKEIIGLTGRWRQSEWNGSTWAKGQNLNKKGDGSSLYYARRDVAAPSFFRDTPYGVDDT